MKLLVAGVKDGRSGIVERVEWEHPPEAADVTAKPVVTFEVGSPSVRPSGTSEYRNYGIPVGTAVWNRVRFPANQKRELHHTNTIDSITIIDGSMWIVLDDGEHELLAGDCVLIHGVDHGWRIGPDGCTTSNLLFGLPE
ncbi:hypothetical protein [Streptomyces sp. JW3]|uniref:hypothetical protein n=1 Tax=Streptomyces sp. JW3 TaxID=3456955 RepID=UPI003FA4363C